MCPFVTGLFHSSRLTHVVARGRLSSLPLSNTPFQVQTVFCVSVRLRMASGVAPTFRLLRVRLQRTWLCKPCFQFFWTHTQKWDCWVLRVPFPHPGNKSAGPGSRSGRWGCLQAMPGMTAGERGPSEPRPRGWLLPAGPLSSVALRTGLSEGPGASRGCFVLSPSPNCQRSQFLEESGEMS